MPKYNSTGIPTNDLLSPKGCLSIATLDSSDRPQGYFAVGNVTDFKVTPTSETLDHYGNCGPIAVLDASITTKTEAKVSFKTDEASLNNMGRFLYGLASGSATNAAVAGWSVYTMIADGNATLGATYPLQNSAGVRAMGLVGALTITTNQTTPVSLVLGTDYTVDATNGTIFLLSTSSVVAASIAAGKGIRVALAANALAQPLSTVNALSQGAKNYAVFFRGINPADNNSEFVVRLHKVQLAGNGDLALILEKAWTDMGFEGKLLKSQDPQALASGGFMVVEKAN